MTDEKERVDWSALMDAHGIDPDADTRGPAVEPDRTKVAEAERRGRSRMVTWIIAVTALFSIAASVAVLVVLLRGKGDDEARAASAPEPPAAGQRPAAFEQTSDGVIVVPPVAEDPPPTAPAPASKAPAVNEAVDKKPSEKKPSEKKPAEAASEEKPQAIEKPPETPPADENLPDEPDQAAVASAMDALHKDIAACAGPAGVSGDVGIKMRIEPDGRVAWASAKLASSAFQSCLDRLFKKAKMPRSVKGATVRQTVALP